MLSDVIIKPKGHHSARPSYKKRNRKKKSRHSFARNQRSVLHSQSLTYEQTNQRPPEKASSSRRALPACACGHLPGCILAGVSCRNGNSNCYCPRNGYSSAEADTSSTTGATFALANPNDPAYDYADGNTHPVSIPHTGAASSSDGNIHWR